MPSPPLSQPESEFFDRARASSRRLNATNRPELWSHARNLAEQFPLEGFNVACPAQWLLQILWTGADPRTGLLIPFEDRLRCAKILLPMMHPHMKPVDMKVSVDTAERSRRRAAKMYANPRIRKAAENLAIVMADRVRGEVD
jgi:hypothetical protein